MYTIKSSVHIFLFSSQTPQKINQPNQPTDFFVSLETNQWQLPMAFPPRQKRGPCNARPGRRLMFSWLRFHSNDGDLHLRFDGLEFRDDAAGVKLLCWEKIGLNAGHFQMSKICMFQEHFLEQDACLLFYRSGKCPYIIWLGPVWVCDIFLSVSHIFSKQMITSNHRMKSFQILSFRDFPWKKLVV